MPAEHVGQDAAEQHADAAAAGHHEAEKAHRLGPLALFLEEQQEQRECDRRDDRAAEALDGARGDQQVLRGREAAGERGEREERDPAQEQPPVAEQVAEPAAQQQEAAEGQQVGVHDPRERFLGEAEIGANRGQRDVHDRRVEHDHQVAQAEDVEREPACAAVDFIGSLRLLRGAASANLIARSDEFRARQTGLVSRWSTSPATSARCAPTWPPSTRWRGSSSPHGTRASSCGCSTRLAELTCLIELTGLAEVLRVEPGRKPEEREQGLGVEEEAQLDDPAA